MAERRMFTKSVIDSDQFMDMTVTARLLYYDLGMRADDDGFVNAPKKIMRMIGASEDDLRALFSRKFIIPFKSGVVVISHWKQHNYIPKDRYKPTLFVQEKASLSLDSCNVYQLTTGEDSDSEPLCIQPVYRMDTDSIQPASNLDTQVRIGKDRLNILADKPPKKTVFVPPTVDEVTAYCKERNNGIDPQQFVDFYEASGWTRGKGTKLKNWKAAVRTWESNRPKAAQPQSEQKSEVTYEGMKKVTDSEGRTKWIPA